MGKTIKNVGAAVNRQHFSKEFKLEAANFGVRSCVNTFSSANVHFMARPLRIELSGGVYHVTSRGDGRDDIYLSDADREAWLEVFGQVCERYGRIYQASIRWLR